MVGDKGSCHPTNFQLETVFHKSSSDQIVVFSLEARMEPFVGLNLVIKVILIVFKVISDWANGSRLNFKHNILSIFQFTCAIDLRPQANIVIQFHESVVVVIDQRQAVVHLALDQLLFEFFLLHAKLTLHNFSKTH